MSTKTIKITYAGETAILTCDLAQASAPLVVNGSSTPYQTANARHDTARAVLLACKDAWPETQWPSEPTDGDEAWDEVEYKPVREPKAWVTWGSVRGLGPVRATEDEARRDASEDHDGCTEHGGYSDRDVYAIDDDGFAFAVDVDGRVIDDYVWPHGRSGRALKVDLTEAR